MARGTNGTDTRASDIVKFCRELLICTPGAQFFRYRAGAGGAFRGHVDRRGQIRQKRSFFPKGSFSAALRRWLAH